MSDDEYTDDDSASDAPNDDGLDGKSLYESIGVAKDATPTEIKKAYHRMALKLHPDKNPDNPDAAKQFQTLQKVYGVLGDVDKRKVYDETGRIDDAELSECLTAATRGLVVSDAPPGSGIDVTLPLSPAP